MPSVAATCKRQLGRRMQLSAILGSREEEEGLLTKIETRKMTTMTKNLLPFREPSAFVLDVTRITQTKSRKFELLPLSQGEGGPVRAGKDQMPY